MKKMYSLPELPYGYKDLEPYISEELLKLHHDKHHAAYVKKANSILEKLELSREGDSVPDMKALLKPLSYNIGGHVLHSLYWKNLSPDGGGEPKGKLKEEIEKEFGSFERFKDEFTNAAGVEGSGWVVLSYCKKTDRLMIMQVEKHNVNVFPSFAIIMVLDMWEHAYYLDYKNEKAKHIGAFWNLIDWDVVNKRLEAIKK